MKKHIVFLLHGVGKHTEGWAKDPIIKIKEKIDTILTETNKQPRFELEFKELTYGDIIDANMATMIEGAAEWEPLHNFLSTGLAERNNTNHEPDNNKEKIASGLRDYALDVPTYILNPEITDLVLIPLVNNVVDTIKENPGAKFSFICHSLGTKVGFDLIHRLYSGGSDFNVLPSGLPEDGSPEIRSFYQLASIPEVMNKFDAHDRNPSNTFIKVCKMSDMGEQFGVITHSYRIFGNKFDPIVWIGLSKNISPTVYTSKIQLDYIDRAWMHDFDLYLDHPKVYLPLVEDLCNVVLDSNFKQEKITAYDNSDNNLNDEYNDIYSELKDIVNENSNGINLYKMINDIKTIIEKLKLLDL
jgi:hypothetical protein